MGADLYIQSNYEKNKAEFKPLFEAAVEERNALPEGKARDAAQRKVIKYSNKMHDESGYFRDSYNGTSLMRVINMSWWKDIGPMINEDGNLEPHKAQMLLEIVRAKKIIPITEAFLRESHCQVTKTGLNSVESWEKSFADRKAEFERFLKRAVNLNEPIRCSI